MKKPKTNLELLKSLRNTWTINPRTRVKENEKKNIKKQRQASKKLQKLNNDDNDSNK